jgi:DNA-binding response OmpR family regulator
MAGEVRTSDLVFGQVNLRADGMRALVIEDYTPLLTSVSRALEEQGWAVDSAEDGTEGLWFAQGTDYDAIVLDLMLPGIPGLELLKRLRDAGNESPVLILTAMSEVSDRIAGLDSGADDYLTKPFEMAELLARVRAMARRRGGTRNPVLTIGDLEIDTTTRTIRRTGRDIALSPREYMLLRFLADRPDEVISRDNIWEHVYDFNSDCQSNVVDVYIGYLRKKLEAEGEPRLIHTRRGHGYYIAAHPVEIEEKQTC